MCVKSIGSTKKIAKKTGGECELVDVVLFDHTGDVKMTLWNELIESAREWVSGKTILLVSNPGYKVGYGSKGSVGVQFHSMIEVEPEFEESDWLRKYAEGLTKKESLMLEFPKGMWNIEAAEYGVVRMLFTLAELDSWYAIDRNLAHVVKLTVHRVRSDGHHTFAGFINVTIMDISLSSLHRRNMLMCAEW